MENKGLYENLRQHIGNESKETIWDNAKLIYEQCCDKKYLETFSNQQEFAEYLGITKGRISQYRYAYEYYLLYKDKIDLRKYSVEQVYTFYRNIGSMLFDFLKWLKEEKKISCDEISLKNTKKLIAEYSSRTSDVNRNVFSNDIYIDQLTDKEKQIISFYRFGTDEQRKLIDAIIMR